MIPGADQKLISDLMKWTESAASPEECEVRAASVRAILLDDTDQQEAARIEALLEELNAVPAPDTVKPTGPVAVTVPASAPRRGRLYSSARRGFMRATVEEGIGKELEAMRAEATGTPFFEQARVDEPLTRSKELIERLKKLKRPNKQRKPG